MLDVSDWIWCQYTPGAGGKLLCCISQLDKRVDSWNKVIDADLEKFVHQFMLVDHYQHMKQEPQHPYLMDFYTRQLPFTRGDSLTTKEAQDLFQQKNPQYLDLERIVLPTCKPYLEQWFTGQCVRIVNDPDSMDFLRRRRDIVFYEWDKIDNTKVYLKRFITGHIAHPNLAKRFAHENIKTEYVYESKQDFYQEQFYDHPEVKGLCAESLDPRVVCHINLSDFWNKGGKYVAGVLNDCLGFDIDGDQAQYMVSEWVKFNREFLD